MTSFEQRLEDIEYKIEVLERESLTHESLTDLEENIETLEERIEEVEEGIDELDSSGSTINISNAINKVLARVIIPELLKLKNELDGKASTEEMLRLLLLSQ